MEGFWVLPVTDTSKRLGIKHQASSLDDIPKMITRLAVGVSQHRSFKLIATIKNITAGTIMANRQAVSGAMPDSTIGLNNTLIMKICVT